MTMASGQYLKESVLIGSRKMPKILFQVDGGIMKVRSVDARMKF